MKWVTKYFGVWAGPCLYRWSVWSITFAWDKVNKPKPGLFLYRKAVGLDIYRYPVHFYATGMDSSKWTGREYRLLFHLRKTP